MASTWDEATRVPGMVLGLPLTVLCALFVGTLPMIALDNPVTNLGFKDFSTTVPLSAHNVCGLGLGFIPSPNFSEKQIRSDLKTAVSTFQRRVLLTDYFSDDPFGGPEQILSEHQCFAQLKIPNPT